MAQNEQSKQLTSIKTDIKKLLTKVGTVQDSAADLLLKATYYSYKFSDSQSIKMVADALSSVKGSFRIESVIYWLENVAGYHMQHDQKANTWSVSRSSEKVGRVKTGDVEKLIKFSYDADHLNVCKLPHLKFYKIAPVEIKKLKLPEDLSKVTVGVEAQLARALAAGKFSEEQIKAQIDAMMVNIVKQSKLAKTADWVKKFEAQGAIDKIDETKLELPIEESESEFSDETK